MLKIAAIFVFVAACPVPIYAAANFLFTPQYQEAGNQFHLTGVGAKNILFFKIFTAGLYLGEGISAAQVLNDVPKKLEVVYSQAIPATRLARETRQRMRMNVGEKEYQRLKLRIDVMDKYYMNIKPGDHYALTYIPKIGTRFIYNCKLIGVIDGADFAKGLFAVWFGEKPIDNHLKADLLGLGEPKLDD